MLSRADQAHDEDGLPPDSVTYASLYYSSGKFGKRKRCDKYTSVDRYLGGVYRNLKRLNYAIGVRENRHECDRLVYSAEY